MINGYFMAVLAACVVSITFLTLGIVQGAHKKIGFAFAIAMVAFGALVGAQ
jgi:hypothetical protein